MKLLGPDIKNSINTVVHSNKLGLTILKDTRNMLVKKIT